MSQVTWKFNNVEKIVDAGDLNFIKNYKEAFTAMDESEKILPKTGDVYELLYERLKVCHSFFDKVFGEGTAKELFEDRLNIAEVFKAIDSLYDAVDASEDKVLKIQNNISRDRKKRRKAQGKYK